MSFWRNNPLALTLRKALLPYDKYTFLKTLKDDIKILDVGCGSDTSYYTKEVLPNCHYTGIDVEDYNNKHPVQADEYLVVTPEDFSDEIGKFKNDFDIVISTHNLEHCNDREKTLDAMMGAVKPGGYIYMQFPSEFSVNLPSRGGCLNYYDDPTHKDVPPNFGKIIQKFEAGKFQIIFSQKAYKPAIKVIAGLLNERRSKKENRVKWGTWAYYGFESIIVAKRGD